MTWRDYLRFRDGFAEAMDPRLYTIEWLDWQVFTGFIRLWTSENAAITAEIKTYPSGARALHGLYATGDLEEIISELIPQAEAWGRECGCTLAFIESREAWERLLKPHGYVAYKVAVGKDL